MRRGSRKCGLLCASNLRRMRGSGGASFRCSFRACGCPSGTASRGGYTRLQAKPRLRIACSGRYRRSVLRRSVRRSAYGRENALVLRNNRCERPRFQVRKVRPSGVFAFAAKMSAYILRPRMRAQPSENVRQFLRTERRYRLYGWGISRRSRIRQCRPQSFASVRRARSGRREVRAYRRHMRRRQALPSRSPRRRG